jgi:rubrerythrin
MSSCSWFCEECFYSWVEVPPEGKTKPEKCPECGASPEKITGTEG